MKENFVCLITGPAGSGKSSVTKALATKFERSAVIDVDHLRNMVISGYVSPSPYNDEVALQLSLSVKNACDLANNFLEKGFNVFIAGIVGKKLFQQYEESLSGKNFKPFLLLPSLPSLLERFDQRGENEKLRERTKELHDRFSENKDKLNWQVVDSSNQSLEETVEEIYKQL